MENKENTRNIEQKEENTVIEIIEKEIQNIVVKKEEQTEPCCSWQMTDPEQVTVITTILTESEQIVLSLPQTTCIDTNECQHDHLNEKSSIIRPFNKDVPSEESFLSSNSFETDTHSPDPVPTIEPPAYTVNTSSAADGGVIRANLANCTMIPMLHQRESIFGPPPSYSKSLLDRRINACTSIQFVAPIPPPSYDGADHELRYANLPGFTLGMGNTWQSQSQPAYCIVCEMVTITRTDLRVSSFAHVIALVMFFFLCWPLCLLPYFLNFCNYTFHYCSVCQSFLGARRPFQRN